MAEQLTLTFEGDQVATGRIDVAVLVPSLVALTDLLRQGQVALAPDAPPPRVQVVATEHGSFELVLEVVEALKDVQTLMSDWVEEPDATVKSVIGGVLGVLAFSKWRKGHRIVRTTDREGERVTLTRDDGATYKMEREAWRMHQQEPVRRSARDLVRPLLKAGVDRLRVRGRGTEVEIDPVEAATFDLPAGDEELANEFRSTLLLSIAQVTFVEGNKWRLSDGERTFWATIADGEFLGRVDSGEEAFAKGDMLRVALRTLQYRTEAGGLRTEHVVERVLDHQPGVPASRQLSIMESWSDDEDDE